MPYTLTAPELALLASGAYNHHQRVLVKNPVGAFQEMTNISGFDYLHSVTWGGAASDFVDHGAATFFKYVEGGQSLVPKDQTSLLNRNGGVYEQFLRVGREVQVYWALTAVGVAPSTWYFGFHGRLDEIDWADPTKVRCPFRDLGGILSDADITTEVTYAAGTLESVLQTMLNDTMGVGVITLFTPVATGITITSFKQPAETNLFDALRQLARENGGYDLRYKYDSGTGTFRLTLYLPDLVSTTPTISISASQYLTVNEMKENRDPIKNIVTVSYRTGKLTVSDLASITAYGPRFMPIDLSDSMDSAAGATAAANAALNDSAQPLADHAVENLFYPHVQIRDVIGFAANLDLYSAGQNYSVVSWEHTCGPAGYGHTVITTKQRAILAGSAGWAQSTGPDNRDVLNILTSYNGENMIVGALPSYVPGERKTTPDAWIIPFAPLSRILKAGDYISGSIGIRPSVLTDYWRPFIQFLDANGALIFSTTSGGVVTGTVADSGTYLIDARVPAGTAFISYGAKGYDHGAWATPALGTAQIFLPSLNRGPLAAPYAETETVRSASVRAAIAQAAAVSTIQLIPSSREGDANPLGQGVTTKPMYDQTGVQILVDPTIKQLQNLFIALSTVADDGAGVGRMVENIRGAAIKDILSSGVLQAFLAGLLAREGWSGAQGAQVMTSDTYDKSGVLKMFDAVLRKLNNADIDGATTTIGGTLPSSAVPGTIRGSGVLTSSTVQYDGVQARVLAKGHVTGFAKGGVISGTSWVEGDAVVFPTNFQNVPLILITGGINFEPRTALWTLGYSASYATYEDMQALNPTVSGFTMRARLIQKGLIVFTSRSDNFAGTHIINVGATDSVTLANAPAYDDTYHINYTVVWTSLSDLGALGAPDWQVLYITYSIDSSADGGTTWVSRSLRTEVIDGSSAGASGSYTKSVTLIVSGLSNSAPADKFRIIITNSEYNTNTHGAGSASGLGYIAGTTATYTTSSGAVSVASKTPDQATDLTDRVRWEAIEVS